MKKVFKRFSWSLIFSLILAMIGVFGVGSFNGIGNTRRASKLKFDLQYNAGPKLVNPDNVKSESELEADLKAAIESNNSEAFIKAQTEYAKAVQTRIIQEARQAVNDDLSDQAIMAQRGLNPLTKDEREYYMEVISSGGFDGVQKALPPTVFERVFEELRKARPLLEQITFVNTTGVTEWIMRNNDVLAAYWGTLTSTITRQLEVAFKKEKTELSKLSAFMPVAKAMLDLGPQWLDRFVRECLFESLAIALELAIITGTGKDQPIGMDRDLAGSVVAGVYPQKSTSPLNDLEPATLGTYVMAPLTKNGTRVVDNVLLIVNPLDYWKKIFPGTTVLTASGTYVYGVLPIPAKVIQSVAVAEGKLIAGMAKNYFMGVGSNQKIEYSDQYHFLEDERVYLAKQYANGKPMDNDSFLVFDITGMPDATTEAES